MFKKFEGRLNRGTIKNLQIDEIIIIRCKTEITYVRIKNIRFFKDFEKLLTFDDNALKNTLPYVNTLEEGITLYKSIYKEEDIYKHGTVSIELEKI